MTSRTVLGSALLLALALSPALAQPGGGKGRAYDPATETTAAGVVSVVDRVPHGAWGRSAGIHLQLKADSGETLTVQLGPSWWIDEQPLKIAAGDRIQVRGSAVVDGGKPSLIAAEIQKGDQKMVLRDPAGMPAWAGGRRGGR